MRITYQEFKNNILDLAWDKQELADKLSAIGFETEVEDDTFVVSLTANRRADCTNANMVAFDLAEIYNLKLENSPTIEPGIIIPVTLTQVNKLLGTDITFEDYKQIERLGFNVKENEVVCPSFRKDLETFADIAEEVIRLLGYETLNLQPLSKKTSQGSPDYAEQFAIKQAFVAAGLTEALTTTFTEKGSIEIKNPVNSNERFMRPTLQDGLLQVLARNPFLKRATFFEMGSIFNPEQETKVGIIIAGYKDPSKWADYIRDQGMDNSVIFQPVEQEKLIKFDVKQGKVFYTEINLSEFDLGGQDAVIAEKFELPKIKEISKYPPLVRDFTLTATTENIQEIITSCKNSIPEILLGEIVDVFSVPDSTEWQITIRFILQKLDGSFTESDIQNLSTKLEDLLKPYQKG